MILHIRSRREGKCDTEKESAQQKGKLQNDRTMATGSQYSNNASVQRYFENFINRAKGSTQAFY